MQAGRLTLLLTIERAEESRTPMGGVSQEWVEFAKVRAMAEQQKGREFEVARSRYAEVTEVFRFRWHPGITPKMRAKLGERVFNITAVINVEERNRETLLYCTEF
jgi:SPP1 family predicted phage head-tail adaptor